jgi:hypothetical protein
MSLTHLYLCPDLAGIKPTSHRISVISDGKDIYTVMQTTKYIGQTSTRELVLTRQRQAKPHDLRTFRPPTFLDYTLRIRETFTAAA